MFMFLLFILCLVGCGSETATEAGFIQRHSELLSRGENGSKAIFECEITESASPTSETQACIYKKTLRFRKGSGPLAAEALPSGYNISFKKDEFPVGSRILVCASVSTLTKQPIGVLAAELAE